MKRTIPVYFLIVIFLFAVLFTSSDPVRADVLRLPLASGGAPQVVSYQGQVTVGGRAYNGPGYFKFALVNQAGNVSAWSNDSTSIAGSEPASAIAIVVSNGLFNVLLGDTSLPNMAALPASAFSQPDRFLRVWFSSTDTAYSLLSPDRRIAAVPYALQAENAGDAGTLGGQAASAFAASSHTHPALTASTGLSGGSYTGGSSAAFSVVYGASAGSAVQGSQTISISAGSGLTGGVSADALGDGVSATLNVVGGNGISASADNLDLGPLSANWNQTGAFDVVLNNAASELSLLESAGGTYYGTLDVGDLAANQTYNFTTGGTVWTSGNDGAGSALDADQLDGLHASAFAPAGISWLLGGNAISNPLTQFLGTTNAQPLVFRAFGTEYMRLDTNGRLGIGTTAPTSRLYVQQSTASGTVGTFNNTATAGRSYAVVAYTNSTTDGTHTVHIDAAGTSGNTDGLYVMNRSTSNNAAAGYFTASGATGMVTGVWADISSTNSSSAAAYFRVRSVSGAGYAGWFQGNVRIQGTLTKSAGSFKIDNPLNPANQTLSHSFVESPDMLNIYNGNIVLDENGEAVVLLPDWFEALNKDFRYQLTCIGGFAQVYIAEEVQNNQFKIGGGSPGLKVSWQVTGVRKDPYAEMNRIPVVQDKPAEEVGTYLCPQCYGQPALSESQSQPYAYNENPTR